MEKIKILWRNTLDELLNKVSWPSWDELKTSTLIVLVASLIFSVVIYLIDTSFGFISDMFYKFLE
ncbi:MAG: preprotein translocase subunit SecE [Bacteroidia bacterium]|nr:preprotein translocase subunit SecE [Bacteroidia bacterium]